MKNQFMYFIGAIVALMILISLIKWPPTAKKDIIQPLKTLQKHLPQQVDRSSEADSLYAAQLLPDLAQSVQPKCCLSDHLEAFLPSSIFHKKEISADIRQSLKKSWKAKASLGWKEYPQARLDYELRRLKDPHLDFIPKNIEEKEQAFMMKMLAQQKALKNGDINLDFVSRGPINVGGRTRALAIDAKDEDIILAGGVSGGMWRSINGGQSWARTTSLNQIPSVTCVLQDRRLGKSQTWYYGTGEITGNSASDPGALFRGDGIFRSENNGQTWTIIPSTSTGTITLFDSPFKYVNSLAMDYSNETEDEIYAAVISGIIRTTDGFKPTNLCWAVLR
ncbi:MAG: hypothetical protein HC880_00120 [Bacteroidia bacterium]|nr:hypothetical protein [Bacteroidia bacterium]